MASTTQTKPTHLSEIEKLSWLRLIRTQNIGPLIFHRLLNRFGSAVGALQALPDLAAKGGRLAPLKIYKEEDALKELETLRGFGAYILCSCEEQYPLLLKEIDSAPPLLILKGNANLLAKPTFAVVGARNASMSGKKLAVDITQQLAQNQWVIASGLARGIDTHAHKTALETGTIAVVAGGIDQIYPAENKSLYQQIVENGLIIAESPFGTQPQANLFPRRNRIISGIAKATVVIEAALKSGSLITARYAVEQGRDVFSVPGSPLDPRARGTNQLIREGAILTESYEDIEREMLSFSSLTPNPISETSPQTPLNPPQNLDPIRKIILENVNYTPIRVDSLIQEYQIPPTDVWSVLLEMEIAGRLNRQPGGYISLKPSQDQE